MVVGAADTPEQAPGAERVVVDLAQHCIETATRRAYRRLVREQLDGSFDFEPERPGDIAARLDLLREFLAGTDFASLRAQYPELRGGSAVHVLLERTPTGGVGWSVCPRLTG